MRSWVIAVVVAVGLAGCGGDDEPDRDSPERTVNSYLTALAEGDGERACEELTPDAQAELSGLLATQLGLARLKDCVAMAEQLGDVLGPATAEELLDGDAGDVRVDGATATASPPGGPARIRLVRRGGDWQIDEHLEGGWPEIGVTGAPRRVPPSQVPGGAECDPSASPVDCG